MMNRAALAAERLQGLRSPSSLVASGLIVLLHGTFTVTRGVMLAPDTASYDYWAGRLVDSGFAYLPLLAEAETGFPAALYLLFVSLLALLKLLFAEQWPLALVALNLAAHVALGAMIVRLAFRTTGNGAASWTALLLYLACHDLLVWVPFTLSDATFVTLAFCIFTLAAARILGEARGWLALGLAVISGIFYRPTGIVLLPDLAWAVYLARNPDAKRRAGWVLLAGCGGFLIAASMLAWIVQDPSRWPFSSLARAFGIVAEGYSSGEVVSERLETYHDAPQRLTDYVLITLDRLVHFFAIGAADYSIAHWLVSLAFFVPVYGLAGLLLVRMTRGRTAFGSREQAVFLAAAGAVFAYASFHALVQVDFDWRYRAPILPHLILLAAGGAADLVRRASNPGSAAGLPH